jgi:hypothetical protein
VWKLLCLMESSGSEIKLQTCWCAQEHNPNLCVCVCVCVCVREREREREAILETLFHCYKRSFCFQRRSDKDATKSSLLLLHHEGWFHLHASNKRLSA